MKCEKCGKIAAIYARRLCAKCYHKAVYWGRRDYYLQKSKRRQARIAKERRRALCEKIAAVLRPRLLRGQLFRRFSPGETSAFLWEKYREDISPITISHAVKNEGSGFGLAYNLEERLVIILRVYK